MNALCKIFFIFRLFIAIFFIGAAWQQSLIVRPLQLLSQAAWIEQLPAKAEKYDCADIIQAAADQHNLPPELITAVIHAESNFNPNAHSSAGAKGLMQINEPTRKHLKIMNIWDPKQNIAAGSKYLRELLNRFHGNTAFAIAAYNAGPGTVSKYNGIPPYRETQNYVRKVMKLMKQYRGDEAFARI